MLWVLFRCCTIFLGNLFFFLKENFSWCSLYTSCPVQILCTSEKGLFLSSLYPFLARWKGSVTCLFAFSFPGWTYPVSQSFYPAHQLLDHLSGHPPRAFFSILLMSCTGGIKWDIVILDGLPTPASERSWWSCSSAATCAEQLSNPSRIWKHNSAQQWVAISTQAKLPEDTGDTPEAQKKQGNLR